MIKNQVAHILETIPKTRNNDKSLILNLWYRYYPQNFTTIEGQYYIKAESVHDMPSPESIRRTRQAFQEAGQYQSDEQIAKHRKDKEDMIKKAIVTDSDTAIKQIESYAQASLIKTEDTKKPTNTRDFMQY